ncbi:MAG TPA: cyclic nucleotide-binding domain-containing protein [Verrucomicrobiae bacterium]|nr:cyclic nucleotide-binding domain-containing protein [Verrucomicrobiae bacterium]
MTSDVAILLRDHPFTRDFWPDHVARLATLASEVHFAPGDVIFEEGDPSSLFYLIVSGNVALEVKSPGRPVRIATLYAGEVLGWSSVTGDTGKQFQARALEDVHALAFDGTRLRHACTSDYAFGFRFMSAILSVTSERLHSIRAQLLELYSPVGVGQ